MGIFQSKESKEIDLALNYLNECLIKHYQDWDWVLKMNIGAEAASQQPLEGVIQAVRTMWVECLARSVYIGIDCRHQYDLVKIKTPAISRVLSESQFAKAEFQQASRIIQLMQDLIAKISEIKPAYRDELAALKLEPEFSLIQAESQAVLKKTLENGKINARTEMFVIKGRAN